MLAEMIEKIESMGKPNLLQRDTLTYSDKSVHLVRLPIPDAVEVMTLTGLADVIRARVDELDPGKWLLMVDSHEHVTIVARHSHPQGDRPVLAALHRKDGDGFRFGQFLPREEFVIGLQSKFVQSDDLPAVLKTASTLEASRVSIAEDDGVSQRTTVRQGTVLKQETTVKGRVTLRPYRTFREVEQPASEFVFRLRSQEGEVPTCALFEADGGKWKLDAVLIIKKWLEEQKLGLPVVA